MGRGKKTPGYKETGPDGSILDNSLWGAVPGEGWYDPQALDRLVTVAQEGSIFLSDDNAVILDALVDGVERLTSASKRENTDKDFWAAAQAHREAERIDFSRAHALLDYAEALLRSRLQATDSKHPLHAAFSVAQAYEHVRTECVVEGMQTWKRIARGQQTGGERKDVGQRNSIKRRVPEVYEHYLQRVAELKAGGAADPKRQADAEAAEALGCSLGTWRRHKAANSEENFSLATPATIATLLQTFVNPCPT